MTDAVKGRHDRRGDSTLRSRSRDGDDADRSSPWTTSRVGKLAVLAGVREFPVRVKCASLAWHTLKSALAGAAEPVKTE